MKTDIVKEILAKGSTIDVIHDEYGKLSDDDKVEFIDNVIRMNLLGTSKSLWEVLSYYGIDEQNDKILDKALEFYFQCDYCDRWYDLTSLNELRGYSYCDSCFESDDADDDEWDEEDEEFFEED